VALVGSPQNAPGRSRISIQKDRRMNRPIGQIMVFALLWILGIAGLLFENVAWK
jgi:hypothetical protein